MHTPEHTTSRRYGTGMLIAMWLLILALLTFGFNQWLAHNHNPNRTPQASRMTDGGHEVTLQRNRAGHYLAGGYINGREVVFMLDTGASDTVIPGAVAERLQLEPGMPRQYRTANGVITGYTTRLDEVALGPIVLSDVRASINPHMDGEEILLGMSFLKHLEFTQRGDTLTLRD